MLADAFRLAHPNLLKLKKYEGLVYNEDHELLEIQELTDKLTNINEKNKSKLITKNTINKTSKNCTY